ncbi:hypothetical protein PQR70_43035, partial [Paraburkholderia madseniana]|uniref:hypothetical protein n=1 Tax=Paraburkholderia madseniana TaxID=2599607 RepID=UPI0038BE1B86
FLFVHGQSCSMKETPTLPHRTALRQTRANLTPAGVSTSLAPCPAVARKIPGLRRRPESSKQQNRHI